MTRHPWRQWVAWIVEATLWALCTWGALDSAGETVQCLADGGEPRFMQPCEFDGAGKMRHDAATK